ncbi:MAG TPA: tRNA epoxyqueuosine(34) reductase QueG [Bellilinea sp.]|nr:tRNA epoxyqueuosine(34) reductase QueG [Bellilinea sp.]
MGLKSALKTEAFRLGFTLFGVTKPSQPETLPVYLSWLERGRHGEMAYLSTRQAVERRADPKLILPDVKSIIVVGLRYPRSTDLPVDPDEGLHGRVAAYAWGVDYHDLIPPRLRELAAFIHQNTGGTVASKGYTDTGPILERDLASCAGLGWMGKNTCLIDPHSGSYYLLAELFVDLDLEPDLPFQTDQCGSCRRCLEACPTTCILPDRTIDARRCISYLTIENKGSIPLELRPYIGDWVFGCDLCQQVCPWNLRFATPVFAPDLNPQSELARPNLAAELRLTPQEFNRKFKHSPIRRAKRRGYLRNIAVALGNTRSQNAIPALTTALQAEAEPLVRAHAAWALGQIGGQVARTALEQFSTIEADPLVRAEINAALISLSKSD